MIKHLLIRNFQCHRRLDLELDPGVNVVIGPSDTGKSAIIRAINWLCFNEPGGTAFRSHWGGRTVVQVELDDKTIIKRVRSDKDNYYQLNDRKLRGFGRKVPEEVQEALNVSNLNFHNQMDAPFLLSDTPAQVAKTLNSIANLEVVDESIRYLAGQIRGTQGEIRNSDAQIAQLESDLEEYANVPALEDKLADLTTLVKKMKGLLAQSTQLRSAIAAANRAKNDFDAANGKYHPDLGKTVEKALKQYERKKELHSQMHTLEMQVVKIKALKDDIAETKATLASKEEELHKDMADAPCPLCGRSG